MAEATILAIKVKPGEEVATDQEVIEVETDKAVATVDAPLEGRLIEIIAGPGTVVPLGGRLGTIRREG